MSQLLNILKAEGRRIAEEFALASGQGEGTPQEIADFREHAVQSFLERFYPRSFIVSKGKITDLDGLQSDSIDCILLNPAHPHLIDSKGKFRLIIADGCDAAVEVKPNLARTDELHRALQQCTSVKKTKRSKSAILLEDGKSAHLVEHSKYIPFFVFAMRAFDAQKLHSEVVGYYRAQGTLMEEQIDGICVWDTGLLKNVKHKDLNVYGAPPPIGQTAGWYFEHWGEATPLGFLLSLEYTFSSFPGMTESIMKRMLTRLGRFHAERMGDGV